MKLKVVRRGQVIYHSIFMVLFALCLHYLLIVILSEKSLLNTEYLLEYLKAWWPVVGLGFMTGISLFFVKKSSFTFMVLFNLLMLACMGLNYFESFNKGILVTGFIYFICSYFILLSLYFELKSPAFNPGVEGAQIDNRYLPSVIVKAIDESGNRYTGTITRISEDSFFAIDNEFYKMKGALKAQVQFEGISFDCGALEISRSSIGRGFKIIQKELGKGPFTWKNFYSLLKDRGYYFE